MKPSDSLVGFAPRRDATETFYPDRASGHAPAMLNSMKLLSAAAVGVNVLGAIAARSGTRVKPSAVTKLIDILDNALPDEVSHHCEAEAERILTWLAEAPTTLTEEKTGVPELDIVRSGDLESRRAVAVWAMNEGMDLEAEFYDADRRLWRRVRATPQRIEEIEGSETLVLHADTANYELAISDVRWLMPVERNPDHAGESQMADVLPFPGA